MRAHVLGDQTQPGRTAPVPSMQTSGGGAASTEAKKSTKEIASAARHNTGDSSGNPGMPACSAGIHFQGAVTALSRSSDAIAMART